MNRQRQRPYEKKVTSRFGALFFGVGVGALLATTALVVGLMMPNVSSRVENLPYYARTYYRKLFPPPQYLPTPAPTVSAGISPETQGRQARLEPHLLPTTQPAVPAAEASPTANLDEASPTAPSAATELPLLPTPTASATLAPTTVITPTLTPAPSETPTSSATPIPTTAIAGVVEEKVQLTNFQHQWQTWNNCGPATITMNTSYFGRPESQVEAAQFLKPNRDDKNVNPQELAAYARTLGLEAMVRQGGSLPLLKTFLNNGLPVLAETWLVHDGDGLGHYRLVTGYDDTTRQLDTFDSLSGPNYKVDYEQFDLDWRVFNRQYIIVFSPEQAGTVAAILGPETEDRVVHERLVAEARAEIEANPNDAAAHFNLGDALTLMGRYEEAAPAFDEARRIGLHWRRLWYQFTPLEAYYKTGRYQDVIDLAQATINSSGGLEEAYYYQGLALHATSQDGAAEAFETALSYNPNFTPAQEALNELAEVN